MVFAAPSARKLEPVPGVIVFFLDSNVAPWIKYVKYKMRWRIETSYNHVRNDGDFNDLKLEDYYTTLGLSFHMLIEDIVCYLFIKTLRAASSAFVSHMSKKECLLNTTHAKVISNNDSVWHGSRVTSSVTAKLRSQELNGRTIWIN